MEIGIIIGVLVYIGICTVITYVGLLLVSLIFPKKMHTIADEFGVEYNLHKDPFLIVLGYSFFLSPLFPLLILFYLIFKKKH